MARKEVQQIAGAIDTLEEAKAQIDGAMTTAVRNWQLAPHNVRAFADALDAAQKSIDLLTDLRERIKSLA